MPALAGRSVSRLAAVGLRCSSHLARGPSIAPRPPSSPSRPLPRVSVAAVASSVTVPWGAARTQRRSYSPQDASAAPAAPATPPAQGASYSNPRGPSHAWPKRRRWHRLAYLAIGAGAVVILYEKYAPFRHSLLAFVRYSRLMKAVILDIIDYKWTFAREARLGDADGNLTDEELALRRRERKACHKRSADRIFYALKRNGGIYIKIGQHVAAIQYLPREWTGTMTPLQDQCFPTDQAEIDAMLRQDLGLGIDDLFVDFESQPIGVASLAQVHRAVDRRTGREVAVKVQHPDLQEFAVIDLATVNVAAGIVKYIFPEFAFDWLCDEINAQLPIELNFRCEAANSMRCRQDFLPLEGKTSLYLPEVLWAERRCLVMEFIEGARVDDLAYLQRHKIDRNQVSQELSRIFSRMVYLNGFFHADPHHGNILIRPKADDSTSPFNFDICLLDHGQYFDVTPEDLRVNYARFWLSLMSPSSPETLKERKRLAKLIGNVDDDMYPYLESAITGRVSIDPTLYDDEGFEPPASLLDDSSTDAQETAKLRTVIVDREGIIMSIFGLLRNLPRRLIMILKLADLQRALDASLSTTHGQNRIYLIIGRACSQAIWQSEVSELQRSYERNGWSLSLCSSFFRYWFTYAYYSTVFGTMELGMDVRARLRKMGLWLDGLRKGGLQGAYLEAAGIVLPA